MATKTAKTSSSLSLPPLSDLFSASWENLRRSAGSLAVLYVLMLVFLGLGFVVFGVLAAVIGLHGTNVLQDVMVSGPTAFEKVPVANWIGFGVTFTIGMVVLGLLSNAFKAAFYLAVAEKSRSSMGELLRQGFKAVIPLFIVGIITAFLTFGGFMLFVIPGIVIAFLLSFSTYEIVLRGRGPMAALNRSVQIVQTHFGEIFLRFLVLIVGQLVIQYVLSHLGNGLEFLSAIESLIFSVFTIAYSVTLYQQAEKATPEKSVRLTWIWVVAILGWVFLIVIGGASVKGIERAYKDYADQQMFQSSMNATSSGMMNSDYWSSPMPDSMNDMNDADINRMINDTNQQLKNY